MVGLTDMSPTVLTLVILLLVMIMALAVIIVWQRLVIRVLGRVARVYGATEDDVSRVILLKVNDLKETNAEWQTS